MAKRSKPRSDEPDLSHIIPGLRSLAVPIAELVPDPTNPVRHNEKNLAAIRGSLAKFGQRLPVVVRSEGMIVEKGNGVVEAARQLGWTHIARVLVDDDNVTATSFAIADNRCSDLHRWDEDVMEQLIRDVDSGNEDLQQMYADLAKDLGIAIVEAGAAGESDETPPEPAELPDKYQIIVTCEDESMQAELLERLSKEGLECRALIA